MSADNPLSKIPTDLLPMGVVRYEAYGGINWTLSASIGEATIERKEDAIVLTAQKGGASVVFDPASPAKVTVIVPGERLTASIAATNKGFTANTDDGRSVVFEKNGGRIDVHLKGFGAKDALGVFLKRK